MTSHPFHRCIAAALLTALALAVHAAAEPAFPPLMVEVHADHPLFVFRASPEGPAASDIAVDRLAAWWDAMPERFRPYAALHLAGAGQSWEVRAAYLKQGLERFRAADVRVVAEVFRDTQEPLPPVSAVEALFREHANLAGVSVRGVRFDVYPPLSDPALAMPGEVRWLIDLIGAAARYGRFVLLDLDGLDPARLMANTWARPLHEALRAHSGYVFPLAGHRGGQTVPRQSAVLGLWLEGTVAQWGVSAGPGWYAASPYEAPGRLGDPDPAAMPPHVYRAILLNGAMTGATVYHFTAPGDLWQGENRDRWDAAIAPALDDLLRQRLVPRRDFVARKARVAYRLAPAATPEDFHLNLRDIDPVFDRGLLLAGAYGLEAAGKTPELVLNSGRHYWVPFVSAFAPEEALSGFDRVVQPGHVADAGGWTQLLDRYYTPDGLGTAFICQVGRGLFVMHTRENGVEPQTFRIPALPEPLRGFEARRDNGGVVLRWPFREGDVAFRVYRRANPAEAWRLVADNVERREWRDADVAPGTVAYYAVTALTNEEAPFEGTVGPGEYLALSTVESRIAEAVSLGPLLDVARSGPVAADTPQAQPPPSLLEDAPMAAAAIEARLEQLGAMLAAGDLGGTLDLYATAYRDGEGWGFEYVRRAWQWFFERYDARRLLWQAREWRHDPAAPGEIQLDAFCRATGVAVTGPDGRLADQPLAFPRTGSVVTFTFREDDGVWRIVRTEPAFPNMRDLLSVALSPDAARQAGPDVYP